MPFGTTVTSFIADLSPTDPVAPQVVADFVQALPPNPVRGAAVSEFAQSLAPSDPFAPADLGQQLSAFIHLLGPDTGSDTTLF